MANIRKSSEVPKTEAVNSFIAPSPIVTATDRIMALLGRPLNAEDGYTFCAARDCRRPQWNEVEQILADFLQGVNGNPPVCRCGQNHCEICGFHQRG